VPELQQEGKPWFLALNIVNPHDVMYYNTDLPGTEPVQGANTAFPINHEPNHALYKRRWNMPLPASRNEPWDQPGRPKAHYDFQYARKALCGQFPDEDDRWQRLQDYYLNCIADSDRYIARVLQELDELGLAENTIVIITSDHGELAGAHGMHGKGATAYREQLNVPLWVRHPGFPNGAGSDCKAVTSHLDLAPSILAMAGVSDEERQSVAPDLRGSDFSALLSSPDSAPLDAIREGALYNYNMWLYQDADFLQQAVAAQQKGQNVGELGLKINLDKRGAIRSVTDGRYRFSRYFSPKQHNLPSTLEQLFQYNDVELYDLEADPLEMNNLAADPKANGEVLLAMNKKLSALIEAEVGADDGRFLPENKAGWNVTLIDP
jgi:arylsulfatase